MKPVTTIVAILLAAISIAHLLRLIFQVDIGERFKLRRASPGKHESPGLTSDLL